MNSQERKELIATAHKWDHVLNFNIADPNFVHGNEEDPLEQKSDERAWEEASLSWKEVGYKLDRAVAHLRYTRNNPFDNAALILLDCKRKVEAEDRMARHWQVIGPPFKGFTISNGEVSVVQD